MDVIQLLPDSVANQIAAGEVIQRPASVIKELVENAIDAGAKNIQVLICDAGKASIQVIDDGCGMSDTDARLSFERHATSKIREAVDLFALHTMGFRGEALASIAAVAQVTLQTRREEDEVGTKIVIAGSQLKEQEVVSCPVGSNFLIENLFFNIPARRKFLKSNATEMNNITQAFERIALVYPEVHFTLYNNGMEMINLRSGNILQRIIDIFGKRLKQDLLQVETHTTICDIKGFVAKPESAKKKGFHQYFFVNGRFMKHGYFHKAVMSAYDRLLPEGLQVSYFLYLTVDPSTIDVNIHPVKTEIKFNDEQSIWQIMMASVHDAVGKFSNVTTLDFDTEGKPDIPVFSMGDEKDIEAPHIDFNPQYNPFLSTDTDAAVPTPSFPKAKSVASAPKQRAAKGWEEMFGSSATDDAGFETMRDGVDATPLFETNIRPSALNTDDDDMPMQSLERSEEHYQYRGQYIITQVNTGLMIVDQNRASQRILFEKFMKDLKDRTAHTQKVLFPEVMQFPPSYSAMLDTIITELCLLGFEIADLGGNNYTITGIPAGLGGLDAVQLVNDLVSEAVEQGSNATEEINTILATELARKAATPYGEILNNDEMEALLKQLFECSSQRYTPDGKTIISIIDDTEMLKHF